MRARRWFWWVLVGAVAVFMASCGSGDGLSQAEVDEAIADALASLPEAQSDLTAAEVEQAIRTAIEGLPAPGEGLSMAQVEEAIDAAIEEAAAGGEREPGPPKSDPVAYTQFVVDEAVALYEREGLDGVLEYANDPGNTDGQWYVFVVDEDDMVIGHYDPGRRGLDLKEWVGTDINGYVFGPEMLAATEDGRWVGYVYRNPDNESNDFDSAENFELKNAWVVRHDGLLFGSGWYIDVDMFITDLADEIAEKLAATGLEATIAFYSDPQNLTTGLTATVAYYNSTETADGPWLAFYADADGTIAFHSTDPNAVGSNITDVLGPAVLDPLPGGSWITEIDNPEGTGPLTMRIHSIREGDVIFGTGWYTPE